MIHNYKICEKIGSGSFGTVFKGSHIRTLAPVAIKVEKKCIKMLKNEAKIYQYLGTLDGFTELKWFGSNEKCNYMVTELLGHSLTDVISHYKVISLKNALMLGVQIISRIELLHEHLLIHRDLKPDNLLFGLEETSKLYLIDFGFCKRYTTNEGNNHIPEKQLTSIVGSPNFISLNIHRGIEPSRRDDIESCVYILLYMMFGELEWFNLSLDEVYSNKSKLTSEVDVPVFIKAMLEYIYTLQFSDKPDYAFLISLIRNEFERCSKS